MIIRMLLQSWLRSPRRKILVVTTVFLAASLLSALLLISLDIGDQMSKEMKSYGANIQIVPVEQAALPTMGDEEGNPLAGESYLDEEDLPNILDIFWRNNIVGFAPLLPGEIQLDGKPTSVIGTFFDQYLEVEDDDNYHTGHKTISPYWEIQGDWPDDEKSQILVGANLAKQRHWQVGDAINFGAEHVTVTGIVTTGGEEEDALVMPLHIAQKWLKLPDKVASVRVSALTVPENDLSRRALQNPDALDATAYDKWYCTAYVSAISHQLEEAISGVVARPIWQVAASEGVIIGKIQWLLLMSTCAALLAAAMGIASLMTGTLIERSGEIGLMKALGAENWRISVQFYAEAILSSLLGGILGCLAGWAMARAIGWQLFGEPLAFSWIVIPSVLVISIIIALVGTWLPARRIAKLYPVEALYGRT